MSEVLGNYGGNYAGKTDEYRYAQKKLPISGEDYKFRVDKKGSTDDFSIEKKADTVSITKFDHTKDVTITNDLEKKAGKVEGKIVIKRNPESDSETITQSGDRIFIDRAGTDKDVEILKKGNEIIVNRMSTAVYTKFRSGEESWEIDREGYRNDVKIFRDAANPKVIKVDRYGDADDISVERTDDKGLDINTWYKEVTMTPEGFNLITGWLANGLNAEDLVFLTEDGNVKLLDEHLR
ncbi:MAG: hypothetical protein LWY06_14490 [Firmicutes bacterium]|nr:hypothetical protein [Bacillota bacterium]